MTITDEKLREAWEEIKLNAEIVREEERAQFDIVEAALAELEQLRAAAREYLDALQEFANDGMPHNKFRFDDAEAALMKLLPTPPAETAKDDL